MPRRETPFLPGQYYYIYNRGNNRQVIFFERANYAYFLKGIQNYLVDSVDILAYCLMPTHYHMFVRVRPDTSEVLGPLRVSRAMKKLVISYTKAINKRYNRVGALFQGQFRSKPITNNGHFMYICIYIHLNPVKDGIVNHPEEWEYSNFRDWMKLRHGSLVDREFIRDFFGSPAEYQQLIEEYPQNKNLNDEIKKYLESLED